MTDGSQDHATGRTGRTAFDTGGCSVERDLGVDVELAG
jgi:hypothetical protein